ncbi:MAG: hypothetical protein LBQ05_02885 [Christensenellaceae bacterium]|nr:hypothetical protein [Christensenellaceae bacterium]
MINEFTGANNGVANSGVAVGAGVNANLDIHAAENALINIEKPRNVAVDLGVHAAENTPINIQTPRNATVDLGVRTTAELSFLTVAEKADYGIMITASHNDYRYNGIKVLNSVGEKLSVAEMEKMDSELAAALSVTAQPPNNVAPPTPGKVVPQVSQTYANIAVPPDNVVPQVSPPPDNVAPQPYANIAVPPENKLWCEYLCDKFAVLKNWTGSPHIIIDTGNGAGAKNAERVLAELRLPFEIINNNPDGFNINKNCGAVTPKSLILAVKKHIKTAKKHRGECVGFAFDGDADRCVAVTKRGVLNGDKLIALLGANEKRIVTTKIFNLGVEKSLAAEIIKTDVGDHFVYDAMKENDIPFGGENSGHIIDRRIWCAGDGLVTALLLLSAIKQNSKVLQTPIKIMPTINKNLKILPSDKPKFENINLGEGVIVRCSGTEHCLRITVMAKTKFAAKKQMKRTISFAKSLIKY